MPNYRRLFVPGGDYFFTVNLLDRRQSLLTENIEALREAYTYVEKRHPFETLAICVLPDHLHSIWQRRFWEHFVRDAEDLDQHVDYIHFNPVKHGFVDDPVDWPYSTWHHWKRKFARPINVAPTEWKPVHLGER